MEVVILAGGLGTRLSEYTDRIPKPMVPIGGKPILWHIMQRYASFGHKDFIIALGYKSELIKEYFLRFSQLNSDFSVNLGDGSVELLSTSRIDWRVTLVDTGERTATGGRLKRLSAYIKGNSFMMTYGDGVSGIDLDELIRFHGRQNRLATVTAVRPPTRFGELSLNEERVTEFAEKPQMDDGWISGGYFVLKREVLDLIASDEEMFERGALEKLAETNQLSAYKHHGYWQCMDTKRDLDTLEEIWSSGVNAPWVTR